MIDFKYNLPSFINHGNFCIPKKYNKSIVENSLSKSSLVFVSSVGREGSQLISSLIRNQGNIASFHEKRPFCNGKKLIESGLKGNILDSMVCKNKFAHIADHIEKRELNIYLESNHMFIKTFGNFFLEEFDLPFTLISIRRPITKTIKSFLDLDWFGDRYSRAAIWIYKVDSNSYLPSDNLIIDGIIDEVISYIISEKINEIRFKELSENRVNYIKINVPPKNEDIENLERSFDCSEAINRNIASVNTRASDKIYQLSSTEILEKVIYYFEKNASELKKKKVHFSLDSLSFEIGGESWKLV